MVGEYDGGDVGVAVGCDWVGLSDGLVVGAALLGDKVGATVGCDEVG